MMIIYFQNMKHANMTWHKNTANVDKGILPKTEDWDKGVTIYAGPSHIWVNKVSAPYQGPINLHSFKLFCSGVPVSTIRRNVVILFIALDNAVSSFFNMWPSSHTTRSGPENGYNYKYIITMIKVTIPSQYHTYSCTMHIFFLILVYKQDCKSILCTLSRRHMHDMVTSMLINP